MYSRYVFHLTWSLSECRSGGHWYRRCTTTHLWDNDDEVKWWDETTHLWSLQHNSSSSHHPGLGPWSEVRRDVSIYLFNLTLWWTSSRWGCANCGRVLSSSLQEWRGSRWTLPLSAHSRLLDQPKIALLLLSTSSLLLCLMKSNHHYHNQHNLIFLFYHNVVTFRHLTSLPQSSCFGILDIILISNQAQ